MATVRKEKIFMRCTNQAYMIDIKCNSSGKFSIDLPLDIATQANKSKVFGDSLKEALDAWKLQVENYAQAKCDRNKVIIYKAGDRYSDDEVSVSIAAGAYWENCLHTASGKIYTYEDCQADESDLLTKDVNFYTHRNGGKKADDCIPYTEQAVAFFNDFHRSLGRLQNMLKEITDRPKDLLQAISLKVALLPAPSEES